MSLPRRRLIKEPSYLDAIVPLLSLVMLIGGSVYLFGVDTINGPAPLALIICSMVAALVILKNGHPWEEIAAAGDRQFLQLSALFLFC